MEKKYHLGQEIKKELERQSITFSDFADAINLSRQAVYEIFHKTSINTEQLGLISRILRRDFLSELACYYKNGGVVGEESLSMLMYDELQIINKSQVKELAKEYFSCPRKKPLLVVCDRSSVIMIDPINEKYYDGTNEIPNIFRESCNDILGKGMFKTVDGNDIQHLDSQMELLASLPQKVIEIAFQSCDFDAMSSFAEKLIEISGKFVILYWDHVDKFKWSNDRSTLEKYGTQAEDCFEAWRDRIHMFVADNKYNDYSRRQRLWQICNETSDDDILFQAQELKDSGKKEEAIAIMTEALKKKIYSLHEGNSNDDDVWSNFRIKEAFVKVNGFIGCGEEDMSKCIRCHVTNEEQTPEMQELLRYNLITGEEVGFWYDKSKEDGKIVDWQYSNSSLIRKAWGIDNAYTVKTEIKEPAKVANLILYMLNNLSSHNFKKKTLTVIVPAECEETYRLYPEFAGMDVEFIADGQG